LSPIFKIVCITDTGDQRTGRCGTNPFQFHQSLAAVICFCHAGQNPVIFSNIIFNTINVFQQVINTLLNLKWQRTLLLRNHVTQGICTLWGDDTEFRYQTSQSVICCCFLFDKTLSDTV